MSSLNTDKPAEDVVNEGKQKGKDSPSESFEAPELARMVTGESQNRAALGEGEDEEAKPAAPQLLSYEPAPW